MTIKDEVLQELRRGTPFTVIQTKFRSQSEIYRGLREYFEEVEKTRIEKRRRLEKVTKDLKAAQAARDGAKKEKATLARDNARLAKVNATLNGQVNTKTEKLRQLTTDVAELEQRGFTTDVVQAILAIKERRGSTVLTQLKLIEKTELLTKAVSELKGEKAHLQQESRVLRSKKAKTVQQLGSQKNRLDELKVETRSFRDAITVVEALFKKGYTTEDIHSLAHGLTVLGILGDPIASITRLVKGLDKERTLMALEDHVAQKRDELAMVTKAIWDAKTELEIAKHLIETFEEVRDAGVGAITETGDEVTRTMQQAATRFDARVEKLLDTMDAHIHQILEGVKAERGEWGELHRQKGKLENDIRLGRFWFASMTSDEYLAQIPLSTVVQLIRRLQVWSEIHLQETKISPSENIHRKKYSLYTWESYPVPLLFEFLSEGLRDLDRQQSLKG